MRNVSWLKSVLPIVLLFLPVAALAQDSTAIGNLVARFHAENRFDGAVLVAQGDRVIYEGGFGEADRTWHVPNRPDTVFLVGSVSKQFTSMLILQLAAGGKLSLMDPLSKHLPSYPRDKAGITIHNLLCHNSGLPHYGGFSRIDIDLGDYLRLDRPVAHYVDLIGKLELQTEPGAVYSYSSMGYIVLAYIAEQVTGKSYGRLIAERIAGPIGAPDLGFAYDDALVERLAHGYVFEIRREDGGDLALGYAPEPYRDQSNKYSTGGVHASARALFRWARAVVGDDLLAPAWRDRMWTPHALNYGYGWRIDPGDRHGLPAEVEVISHGGSLSGYRASIMLLDRGRYTLIALGNSDTSRSSAVTAAIAAMLHGIEPDPPNILGTALAWRMVRDGIEVGEAFFRQQQDAGFPDYVNNDYAFFAYAEQFAEHGRPDYGRAVAELGLESHPRSPMVHLGLAMNQKGLGELDGARASAEKVLTLAGSAPSFSGAVRQARELLTAIEAETPVAVGE